MDQQDMPEVSFREARDIVAMLWHRTSPAGPAHRGGVVRTEAVTTHDVAAPCAAIPASLSVARPATREPAGSEALAGVLDASA
ncbi:hypothetical protein [Burkholderia plantarii]|uniref:hypothetical protein n=1 Tax=Burkholderia plantarii TaxID=41899 RepID=UPI0018DE0FE0|nr:hypothetical protein [Burkholderia plantarii]MBI0330150.1 hypothetical protein [Burkholderia plantarii]